MYDLAGEKELDLEALRARLRRMNNDALLRFGKSARYMCSPEANLGKEPRKASCNAVEATEPMLRIGAGRYVGGSSNLLGLRLRVAQQRRL